MNFSEIQSAKLKLDTHIDKQRTHMYKPIQIAEILYAYRTGLVNIDPSDLNTYRTQSRRWRNDVTMSLVGRVSTSSSRYQDDLFGDGAIPPKVIEVLAKENNENNGIVESYIYHRYRERLGMVKDVSDFIHNRDETNFSLEDFFQVFNSHHSLKKSSDKVYEIIVYSLFYTIVSYLDIELSLSIKNHDDNVLHDFSDFNQIVLGIPDNSTSNQFKGNIFRVGTTNAADKGLDMLSNFGPVIQVKHLALTEELSEEIADSINSDQIVIACKAAEKALITSVLQQIGWGEKIQGIVTELDLIRWYNLCFSKYQEQLGGNLLVNLRREFAEEFPHTINLERFLESREYFIDDLEGTWKL